MTEVFKNLTVDLSRKGGSRPIFAVENDTGLRKLKIKITDDGSPYDLDWGTVAILNYKRADGISGAILGFHEENGVLVTLNSLILGVPGQVICSLSLSDENKNKVTSSEFCLDVSEALYLGEELDTAPEYGLLLDTLARLSEMEIAENERCTAEEGREAAEKARDEARVSFEEAVNAQISAQDESIAERMAAQDKNIGLQDGRLATWYNEINKAFNLQNSAIGAQNKRIDVQDEEIASRFSEQDGKINEMLEGERGRFTAEIERATAEEERAEAEAQRAAAELQRAAAEAEREAAESKRREGYEFIPQMQDACLTITKHEESENKFNPATATQQNFSGGALVDDTNIILSDVIPCNFGDTIFTRIKYGEGGFGQCVIGVLGVDENDTIVSLTPYQFGKYTLPDSKDGIQSLKGVRVLFNISHNSSYGMSFENRENIVVGINADPTEYSEYSAAYVEVIDKVEMSRQSLQGEIDKCAAESIKSVNGQTPDENGNISIEINENYLIGDRSVNLFNKDAAIMDHAIFGHNGALSEYQGLFASDYIKVKAGFTYTMTSNGSAAFYKEVDGELKFLSNAGMNSTVTAPEGAEYIRFCAGVGHLETYMFVEGDTLPPYEPYGLYIKPENIGEDSLQKIKQYIDENADEEAAAFDPNHLTKLRDHLCNPFVRTQITLVGDSITAGVGGTGFDTESPESGIIGDGSGSTKANVLTATCWSNMFYWYVMNNYNGKAWEVDVMTDGINYQVPYRRGTVNISGDPVIRPVAILNNDSIVGDAVSFTFYGTSAVVKYAKGTDYGIFKVYVDDELKATVDCYVAAASHDNTVNIAGLTEGYHTLRIATTNSKNANSSANTVYLEGFVVTKYALVNPWGIGGLTSDVAGNRGFYSVSDDFIIMQFGTNDRGTKLGRETTTVNLVNAVKMIKKEFGADVLLMCANPTTYAEEFQQYAKNFHTWDVKAAVAKAASILKVPYIDNYDAFLRYCDIHGVELGSLLADNLHPNDLGYKVMFENIMRSLDLPLIHLDVPVNE